MKNLFLFFLILSTGGLSAQSAIDVPKISITVSKLESIVPFYEEVLTFKKVEEYQLNSSNLQRLLGLQDDDLEAKVAVLQLGKEKIELIEFINEDRQRAIPEDARSNDLWFQHIAIVVSDMEAAYKRLRKYKVQHVSTSPQTLPDYLPAAAGISAFYFRDPDGHNLEIIHFPAGKGDPRWQNAENSLFLGIDHTAIGIDDTDQSSNFYQNLLGLKIAGNSENYGSEQEHLNQVFGAHLIITGLKAQEGIGVEFLDYLAPPRGRSYPADSRATDLIHWHTFIKVDNIEQKYRELQTANVSFISNGITEIKQGTSASVRAFLVRDPDGHAVLILGS